MNVEHKSSSSKGVFTLKNEDETVGRMTYSKAGDDKFIIDHTEVEEKFIGTGHGIRLVKAAVEFARENNLKIIPLCPFAKSVFERSADLRDVLA